MGNYSFYAIPAAWVMAIAPHFYAVHLVDSNKKKFQQSFDNSNPRSLVSSIGKGSPLHDRVARAEGAQSNGFENLALFASTILVGNFAKLPATTMNQFVGFYLASRALYNLAYINISSNSLSKVRTVIYLSGIGAIFTVWIKAGNALFQF